MILVDDDVAQAQLSGISSNAIGSPGAALVALRPAAKKIGRGDGDHFPRLNPRPKGA